MNTNFSKDSCFNDGETLKYWTLPSTFAAIEYLPIKIIDIFKEEGSSKGERLDMASYKVILYATAFATSMSISILSIPLAIVIDMVIGIAESIFAFMEGESDAAEEVLYDKLLLKPVQQVCYGVIATLGMLTLPQFIGEQIAYRMISTFSDPDYETIEKLDQVTWIFVSHFAANWIIGALFEENVISDSPTATLEHICGDDYFSKDFNEDQWEYSGNTEEGPYGSSQWESTGKSACDDFNFNLDPYGTFYSKFISKYESFYNKVMHKDYATNLKDYFRAYQDVKKTPFDYSKLDANNDAVKISTLKAISQLKGLDSGIPSPQDLLGLPINYSFGDLKKAYRKMTKLAHPDKNNDSEASKALFKAVESANRLLCLEFNN